MTCIDFDRHFADYLHCWMHEHEGDYATVEAMEEDMPRVYARFLSEPAPWLDGETPEGYFSRFQDADALVALVKTYLSQRVPVPDILLERIAALERQSEKPLIGMLCAENASLEEQMLAVTMLREIESVLPLPLYVEWQVKQEKDADLLDNALESLEAMGEKAVEPMLAALKKAKARGQEALLSVLSRYPGHDETLTHLVHLFEEYPECCAYTAAYLGRLGDGRALPALIRRANEDDLPYFDYIEIRNAIEALGGDAPEREYEFDPAYEALYGMDDR